MNEKDLLEEIGKVSEELIAAHALPDAKRFGESGADKSVTAKEHIVMKQKKNEYIRNPFVRALPGIAAAAAVIVAGVIILPKTNLIRMPGTSISSGEENGYRLEIENAEFQVSPNAEGTVSYGTLNISANLFYPELGEPTEIRYGDYSIKKGDTVLYEQVLSEMPAGESTEDGIASAQSFALLTEEMIPVDEQNAPLPIKLSAPMINADTLENTAGDLTLNMTFYIGSDPAEPTVVSVPVTYQVVNVSRVLLQDVTGWHFELAQQELLANNLIVDKRSCYDGEIPEGCVVATEPEGPATVAPGTYVRVYVSLGARPGANDGGAIPAPNFVGLDWDLALSIANGIKINLEKQEVASEERIGTVLSQNVEPGVEVPEGATVVVEVSSGTADSAALKEVEISIPVPENAYGRFYFTVYNLMDLGEDPVSRASSAVYEAGEGLPPSEDGTAAGSHYTPERPKDGAVKVLFSSEANVDAGIMLYNAETGEKAQIGTFSYIHGVGFQELPGRTNPELLDSEEAFRKVGLLK
ncbi:MAG: PASTA domain-containing protein [Oscillospiraceae bacterium]|nr:PASTA domain-containing protein [Oscillospiraceae bacterium]